MIISSITDYREAARRKLPRFLFDYIDGGAFAEQTLKANTEDLAKVLLRQRILKNVGHLNFETELLGQKLAMPVILSPVGLTGMYARRGEVQVAKAAAEKGIPFALSTVSVCSLEEVSAHSSQPVWFQLYVLKDRGFNAEYAGTGSNLWCDSSGIHSRYVHSKCSLSRCTLRNVWSICP
ncbi:alpha-hydroxy-acid oxidizing protein [Legionella cherrii]|uniref:FMN-dependent dehydrogenase n=1 Tax=Legionella cherrii TaxID=28084 RepID=A0ABY6T1E5_9GAMM|nr:alpha-hydroxy-acid oxidizing protein [Legionella cherrii]VEB32729.1 FMN-dependent dehydrogenase [Legionella cherrii]